LVSSETIDRISGFFSLRNHRISSRRSLLGKRLRGNPWWLAGDLQASLEEEACDGSCAESSGVILHAKRVGSAIKLEPANPIDFASIGQRKSHRFRRRRGIAKENFHRCHRGIIARIYKLFR